MTSPRPSCPYLLPRKTRETKGEKRNKRPQEASQKLTVWNSNKRVARAWAAACEARGGGSRPVVTPGEYLSVVSGGNSEG